MAGLALGLLLSACAHGPETRPVGERAVILVSVDGLPADVVDSGRMPALDAMADDGVRARWMNPSFPTLTFSNHWTLATGLRPDRHGIVHNTMRDPALGRFVSKEASAKDARWWRGEPIWATLQRQGGIAATMFWPGSEIDDERRPRYLRAFDKSLPAAARVQQVLDWLELPSPRRPRLLTLYFDQYDVAAHADGARSPPADAALREIDAALARLRAGLNARGLGGAVDLVLVSDHGMADVVRGRFDRLDARVPMQALDVQWAGTLVGLEPVPGHEAEVERALLGRHQHHTCWRKRELPAAWQFGRHPRVPAIGCVADVGWRLKPAGWPEKPGPAWGEHGYAPDAPAMRAVFVANGPSFRRGVVLAPFDNVDVYLLLARLLRIAPAPNDGSLLPLKPALSGQ